MVLICLQLEKTKVSANSANMHFELFFYRDEIYNLVYKYRSFYMYIYIYFYHFAKKIIEGEIYNDRKFHLNSVFILRKEGEKKEKRNGTSGYTRFYGKSGEILEKFVGSRIN